MVKKLLQLFVLVVILIATLIAFNIKTRRSESQTLGVSSQASLRPTPIATNRFDFDLEGQSFTLAWESVDDLQSVSLIPNFEQRLSSYDILEKYGCKKLINGGFYSKDAKPTGLFITDNKTLHPWEKNSLFNGIFSVNLMETPRITRSVPKDSLRLAVQSGPILKENSYFSKLSIINDKEARRSVVATTGENKAIFMIVFKSSSTVLGPTLTSLPKVLEIFESKTGVEIADALNLDGGSASVFYSENFSLPEITYVGSFFCLK